jgi:hypothetical protein
MATSSQEGAAHRRLDVTEGGPERPVIFSPTRPPSSTSPRFQRLVAHLHALGVRPTGELLAKLGRDHGLADEILIMLEGFHALTPEHVARLDACDWPPPVLEPVPS